MPFWGAGNNTVKTWTSWTTTSTTSATSDTAWVAWNNLTTATASTSVTVDAWGQWNGNSFYRQQQPPLSDEEREAISARAAELVKLEQESRQNAERLRQEAKERAEKLLRDHLNEEQLAQLDRENGFEVEAQSGKRYRINRGRAGNVFSLDEHRKMVAKHCIHPEVDCPDQDTMLAQLLWLKWNEQAFLKTANITRIAA